VKEFLTLIFPALYIAVEDPNLTGIVFRVLQLLSNDATDAQYRSMIKVEKTGVLRDRLIIMSKF
jgi:hypothetical protein